MVITECRYPFIMDTLETHAKPVEPLNPGAACSSAAERANFKSVPC